MILDQYTVWSECIAFFKYFKQVVYMVTTVPRAVARIKKNVSRTDRGTSFMSVFLLVASSAGTQMSVSSALWWANI